MTQSGSAAAAAPAGSLYRCRVHHARPQGPAYRFSYRAYYLLLDIDRAGQACAQSHWLSHRRFNLLSFDEADHGSHGRQPLRAWVDDLLSGFGIALAGGCVRLLCLPRVLGYVFNPLSVFYCEHADGSLRALICEVHNTFGEQHCYVLHRDGAAMDYAEPSYKAKCFHVSPLFERRGEYRFDLSAPAERFNVGIQLFASAQAAADRGDKPHQPLIKTALVGERRPLDNANVLRMFFAVPLMTVKIMAAIHWQALKIWLRGGRYVSKPAPVSPPRS